MELRDKLAEIIRNAHFAAHPAMQFGYPEADALIRANAVLLPCKVNDTVWCISASKIKKARVESITINGGPEHCVQLSFDCDGECEGCPSASWMRTSGGEWLCDGEYSETLVLSNDFNKTIFLSLEEAEEALEKTWNRENIAVAD